MNFIYKIKYDVWPFVKVKTRFWWWILKYGGKKKIPREVIFGAMEQSLKRMNDSFMNAMRVVPPDLSEDEKQMATDAFREMNKLQSEIQNIDKKES